MKNIKIRHFSRDEVPSELTVEPGEGYAYSYLMTDPENGKEYTGMTTNSVLTRINNGYKNNPTLQAALNKYGAVGMGLHILKRVPVKYMDFEEGMTMRRRGTLVPNGYNINPGGPRELGKMQSQPVLQLDAETREIIRLWESYGEAERGTGVSRKHIGDAVNGRNRRKNPGGYGWRIPTQEEETFWRRKQFCEQYGIPTTENLIGYSLGVDGWRACYKDPETGEITAIPCNGCP